MTPAIPAAVMMSAKAAKSPEQRSRQTRRRERCGTDVVERAEPMDRLVAIRLPHGLTHE